MLTEDFVSFETAKLLKEKGFIQPEICQCQIYTQRGYEPSEEDIYAPTQALAIKWLREVHKLVINIEFQIDSPTWKWRIYHIEPSEDKHTNFKHYSTYEEACESAIRFCLENLI